MRSHLAYGFTLVEVMVALLVLTLGLLGIAGLQLSGVRNTQGAYYRSQATVAMNDLAERIYANVPGLQQYLGFDSRTQNCAVAPAALCARESVTSAATQCAPAQMAAYDKFVATCGLPSDSGGRNGGIADLIPAGHIWTECLDAEDTACATRSRVRIQVSWSERQSADVGGAVQAQAIGMVVQP
ncbi:MAG: type IV pilus modification protein PilV [Stenotrophobium sp.]